MVKKIFGSASKIINMHPRAMLFFICFLIQTVPIINISTLSISDELGTIANAAYAAGYDWSTFVETVGLAFYRYGTAILYIPLFWIFKDPVLIYKFSLVICGALLSTVPVLVYNILVIVNGRIKRSIKIAVSILMGLLPTGLLWSKQVWSESLMMVLPWVVTYLLLLIYNTASKKKSLILGILAVILSMYTYTVHSRGIAMIGAVVAFVILVFIKERRWLINPLIMVGCLGICWGGDKFLGEFFKSHIWGDGTSNLNNSMNTVVDGLLADIGVMLSFRGIKIFFKVLSGWLLSMILSSFGLILPAFIITGRAVIDFLSKRDIFKKQINIFVVFSAIYFIFSLGVGLLFFFPAGENIFYGDGTERLDKILYIRYVSGAFGLMMLISLYDIFVNEKRRFTQYKKLIFGVFLGTLGIYCFFISDYLTEGTVAFMQVLPVPLFLRAANNGVETVENFNYHILISILFISIVFIAVFLLRGEKRLAYTFNLLAICFLGIYVWSVCFIIYPVDGYFKAQIDGTKKILDKVECSDIYPYIVPHIPRTIYSYQFAFPDYQVILSEESVESNNYIIIDNSIEHYRGQDYYLIKSEDTNIVLKGEEISSYFNSQGIETEYIY